jgi:multidrug resistance efflux pump
MVDKNRFRVELEEQRCLIEQQQVEIQRQRRQIQLQQRLTESMQTELEAIRVTMQRAAPIQQHTPLNRGNGNGRHSARPMGSERT